MAIKTQETRTYTAHLLAELLAAPGLPQELHKAISEHLLNLYARVDILKPEHCRLLYPILAELAESAESDQRPAAETNGHIANQPGEEVLPILDDGL